MKIKPYPLTFEPVYKDYLWGGTRIPNAFNRDLPPGIYAESWEIADHDDGMSVVKNGPWKGKTLREVLTLHAANMMGTRACGTKFPLLIKVIDAKQKLSVQVHPNDQTAAQFGGEAKTEAWYMLGENEAAVYCGLNEGIEREHFVAAVDGGYTSLTLRTVPVQHGDTVFVRGGRIHAVAEECLILEIQQNSNTTYRLYDWGRVGHDGQPRELHMDQAMQVINWKDHENPLVEPILQTECEEFRCWTLLECPYFTIEKLQFSAPLRIALDGTSFHALFVAEGDAMIEWEGGRLFAPVGTSILVPAALPAYTLSGQATVLRTSLAKSEKE